MPRTLGRRKQPEGAATHYLSLVTLFLYDAASRSWLLSDASLGRMRNNHAPYGSRFSCSGVSATTGLIATISPDSGAGMSEAAFTDSTSAQASPRATLRPIAGCCT